MPAQQFYIFDRSGRQLFFRALTEEASAEAAVFVPNLCWQLNLTAKQFNREDRIQAFETDQYRCHVFETQTGFWFVVLSDLGAPGYQAALQAFYQEVFVAHCLNDMDWDVGAQRFGEDFLQKTGEFWRAR